MVSAAFALLVVVVVLAVAFDYINGFHDTANAVATVISTNVLPARTAILLAAACNFFGAFLGTQVANTIAHGIADPTTLTQQVVASALIGAIAWNLFTWYFGIPSSSSHAIVGAVIGAVFTHRVLDDHAGAWESFIGLVRSEGVVKALIGLVVSPIAGLLAGFALMIALLWIIRKTAPYVVNRLFRVLQLVSAAFMAFAHGQNDATKAMGVVTMALLTYSAAYPAASQGWVANGPDGKPKPPVWVMVACATAMAAGTASGGHRIIKTMGHKIIKLKPINGFAAETAAATVISTATHFGAPISTTHVISSSIMGVGASKRVSAVRWGVATNMLAAWILTIPISAAVASLTYCVFRLF